MFPFIGPVPHREGHWIAAGFAGHGEYLRSSGWWDIRLTATGMPRILLSTAHIVPGVLNSLGFEHQQPAIAASFPSLPKPFLVTAERVERLQSTDLAARAQAYRKHCLASSKKAFCMTERSMKDIGSHIAMSI